MEQSSSYLTKHEIEEIVTRAITDAFRDLGLSGGKSASIADILEARKDLEFLREWRALCELMKHKGVGTGMAMILMAFAAVLALGVKAWVFQ